MRYTAPQWRPSLAKRRAPLRSVIDVSGVASIMFVLLFLFMAPAMQVDHPRFPPADLPTTEHASLQPAALRDDALVVTITRDGSTYVGNTKIWSNDLPGALREALHDSSEKTVYIKADSRAKYGDVKAVVDRIHDAGVTEITFLTASSRP